MINNFYVIGILFLALFAIGLTVAMTYSNHSGATQQKRVLLLFLFSVMVLISGLRDENVGGDLHNYIPHFEEVCRTTTIGELFSLRWSNYEPGYTLVVKGISLLSHSKTFFLTIISFLSLVGPFCVVKKLSPWPCVSIFIYIMLGFYTNTFNNLRQSLAISIFCLAIPFLLQRRFWPFFFLVCLAGSCHYSAFLTLVAYPFTGLSFATKKLVWYIVGLGLFSLLAGRFLLSTLAGSVFLKYASVLDGDVTEGALRSGAGYGLLAVYFLISVFLAVWYKRKESNLGDREKRQMRLIVFFMLLAVFFQSFAPLMATLTRMTLYFYIPSIIVAIPICLKSIESFTTRTLFSFLSLALCFVYLVIMVMAINPESGTNSQGVIPYRIMDF